MTDRLASRLIDARRTGARLETPPPELLPRDMDAAYRTAAAVADALGETAGWKIGATSARGQAFLGLGEPFWGAVLREDLLTSPARLLAFGAPFEAEPEIAFRLARDLDGPLAPGALRDAVEEAFLAVEVNRPSWRRPFAAGGLAIVADKGVNRALVVGPAIEGWRDRDLSEVELTLDVDGARIAGTPASSGFDPWAALFWLAADKRTRGAPLRAGEVVATGAVGGSLPLGEGQVAWARGGGGTLTLEVEA